MPEIENSKPQTTAEAVAAYSVLPEGTSVDIAKDAPEHGGESGVVMNPAFITRVGGRARATGPRSRVIKLDGTDEYAIINTRFLTNKYAQDAQAGTEDLEATALFWSKKPEDEFKAWTTAVSKDFKTFNKGISWIANNDKINKLLLQTWREIRRSIPGAMLNDTPCKCTIGPAIVFPSAIKGEPGHAIVLTTANTAIFVEFNGPEQKKVIGKLSWVPKFTEMGNLAVLKALAARLAAAVRKERGMASQNDESRQDNSGVDAGSQVDSQVAKAFYDVERLKDYAHFIFKGDNSYKLVAENGLYVKPYMDFLRANLKYSKAENAYEKAQMVLDASTNAQIKQLAGSRIPFVTVLATNLLERDPNAGIQVTGKQYVETFGILNSSILRGYGRLSKGYDVFASLTAKLAEAGCDAIVIPGKVQEAVAFNLTLPDSRGRKSSYETKSAADLRVGDRVTSGPETFEIVEIEEAGRRIEIGFRNEATDKVHFKKELPVTVFALAKPKPAGSRRPK